MTLDSTHLTSKSKTKFSQRSIEINLDSVRLRSKSKIEFTPKSIYESRFFPSKINYQKKRLHQKISYKTIYSSD